MRIPKDIPLAAYIRRLIREDKIYVFYKTDDWLELRAEVLEDFHNECAECLKQGNYTRADCVHHVNEVKVKPELALSKYYIDKEGKKHRQLIPLCKRCHNIVHEKLSEVNQTQGFTNEERW